MLLLLPGVAAYPQTTDTESVCSVSILNQTALVNDRSWTLPNIPANMGPLRARLTCIAGDQVESGSSELFLVKPNVMNAIPEIPLGTPAPAVASIDVTAPSTQLGTVGETLQLQVTAQLADGTSADVTGGESGTVYQSTNAGVASVDGNGLVTAWSSGQVLVSVLHEAVLDTVMLQVVVSEDSDGDGLPDDFEIALGLDPNNPDDALDDPDLDGLTTLAEFQSGTDPTDPDTDGDGLMDGEEPIRYGTSPVLFDTDGDGLSDGLEVLTLSDPLDPTSFNLAAALSSIELSPSFVLLTVNVVEGEASRLVRTLGHLVDGTEIDLTPAFYGTVYSSDDLLVVSFGGENGRIFAGQSGTALLTARNSGFEASVEVAVETFTPTALAYLPLDGFANGVAVDGAYAYVASGAAGVHVVDVSDPEAPTLLATLPTPGNANDVRLDGDLLFVADGESGLQVADVADPGSPRIVGSLALPGVATDVAVAGGLAHVVDEVGLHVVDVSDPEAPNLLGSVETPGRARGVDATAGLAVVADSQSGLHVVDTSDPANPVILGSAATRQSGFSSAAGVVVHEGSAYVADGADRTVSRVSRVDFREPTTPVFVAASSGIYGATGVAREGDFVLTSEFLVNVVPIFEVSSGIPLERQAVDFQGFGDAEGNGLAVRDGLVYLAASQIHRDNGTGDGGGGLYVGRYLRLGGDDEGVPPSVRLVSPPAGSQVFERHPFLVQAEASDDVRLLFVRFLVDGEVVATRFSPPFEAWIQAPKGASEVVVSAEASDVGGRRSLAEPFVLEVLPNGSPVVELIAPIPGLSVTEGTVLTLAATASDDLGVAAVRFLVDGAVVGEREAPPYTFGYAVARGVSSFSVAAEADDTSGQSAVSEPVTVAVLADGPPQAFLLEPEDGHEVVAGSLLDVVAGAVDDAGVVEVRFYVGPELAAVATEAPYVAEVTVPSGSPSVLLAAEAEDTFGQTGTSAAVTLRVVEGRPSTTVVGKVLDSEGLPAAGATVSCRSVLTTTQPDGSFTLERVPAVLDGLVCHARSVDSAGGKLSGASEAVDPVRGGTTDVGEIRLRPFVGPLYPVPKLEFLVQNEMVAVGDVNGDGLDDVVVNGLYFPLGVYLGTADGSYLGTKHTFPVAAVDLLLADFDVDGVLDLAVADQGDKVAILKGAGDGSFGAPSFYPTGGGLYDMASGDFNGDGVPDVVTADRFTDTLSVFLGTGDGGLLLRQSLVAGDLPYQVVVLDADGDGVQDVASANFRSQDVTVFSGLGDGTFTFFGSVVAGTAPAPIAAGDTNGDGLADLVTRTPVEGQIAVHLGLGGGVFGSGPLLESASAAQGMDFVDLDLDGDADLVTYNAGDGYHAVFRSHGDGTFGLEEPFFAGTDPPAGLATGDFNFDGSVDFVTVNTTEVLLVYGNGDGTLESETRIPIDVPSEVALASYDGDGALDMAVVGGAAGDPGYLAVLPGRGDGGFRARRELTTDTHSRLLSVDLNGDGLLDAVTSGDRRIATFLGLGDGTFPGETDSYSTPFPANDVAAGDLNADGFPDVLVAGLTAGRVAILLGDGDGTLTEVGTSVATEPRKLALGDVNGDGVLDMLTISGELGTAVCLFLGQGDASFDAEQILPVSGVGLTDLDVADLDGDGFLDLVVVERDRVRARFGLGDGTFQDPVVLFEGSVNHATLADVTGDGSPDLVLAWDWTLVVLPNGGDGTFPSQETFTLLFDSSAPVVAGDLNGDGLPDLVSACRRGVLSVMLHR